MDPLGARQAIVQAQRLRREIERFRSTAPELEAAGAPMPPFTWEQLERQLVDLTATSGRAALARHLVSATRIQAWAKPPEMVLREVLLLAACLLDESFNGGSGEAANATD